MLFFIVVDSKKNEDCRTTRSASSLGFKTSEASKLAVSTIKDGQKLSANITIAGASGKELTLIEFAGLSGGGDDDFSGMVIRAATKYSPVEIVRASLVTPQPGIPVRV